MRSDHRLLPSGSLASRPIAPPDRSSWQGISELKILLSETFPHGGLSNQATVALNFPEA